MSTTMNNPVPTGWGEANVPSQQGRTAVVTGANAGLGFEAARVLSAKGAKVILACRNQRKGEEAINRLRAANPAADVILEQLDTSDLASVRAFAERIRAGHSRIDLLINNAGIMATPQATSKDGFEMQLATNHLGHFALAGLLLPLMQGVPGSRIVPVGSLAARSGTIDFDDLMGEGEYQAWKAYNQSKLANVMFGLELQRRLKLAGAATIAAMAHPGASVTNLFQAAEGWDSMISPELREDFQGPEQGVLPILFAATAPEAVAGGYYGPSELNEMKGPVGHAQLPEAALDQAQAERLWRVSEELTGVSYLEF
jgi:NAD(P)-dependent dehydrogenase (short-subunit alcohol dehydrogenase family)